MTSNDGTTVDLLPLGATVGKYRILSELGRGGQATAYRVIHCTLDKELVLKLSNEPTAPDRIARDSISAEGKILAELDHPNIARVYDLGFHENRAFLVMEYIRGRNLMQHVSTRHPSPREAAGLVAKLARALGTAHAQGVIHGDIKPQNVLIDQAGEPRVIDFGLARVSSAWLDDRPPDGSVAGTVSFMSPEQALGQTKRIDARTDVFSLGGLLYWLLVGRPPFQAETAADAHKRAVGCQLDTTPLSLPGIPADARKICLRAMAPDRDSRYATAEEMAKDLEYAARRQKRLRPVIAVVAFSILALACAVVLLRLTLSPQYPGRALRNDFALTFHLLGSDSDSKGQVILTAGEEVAFTIEVEKDAYAGVWHIDTSGRITQLFPNRQESNHLLIANEPRTIPDGSYSIKATAGDGVEILHVVASTQPWDLPAGRHLGPYVVFSTPEEQDVWNTTLRGLTIPSESSPAVSEAITRFQVRAE